MHELQTARMPLHQIDSGNAAVVNLLEELLEVCASLVPYPSIWEESAACSALVDAQAQVDVFAETHRREAAQLTVEAATNAQIEGARIELPVHLLLASANAAGGEEGGHAVADGFLDWREPFVSFVGPAPGIAFLPVQLSFNLFQEARRQHAVAVEEDEEVALAVFCAIVARLSGPAVLLRIIAELKLAGILMDYGFAGLARTILHNDDLHILICLHYKALEQLIDLIGTIIYGNYDGVFQNN